MKNVEKKSSKIISNLESYELLLRREFEFIPIIAKHALGGYKLVEKFSDASFSDIVYLYNGDFFYSIRKEGEMDAFSEKFSNAIKRKTDNVKSTINKAVEKKGVLEKAAEYEFNKSNTQELLQAHREYTKLYIFLWLAGLSLDEEIDLLGEEHVDKFNEVRNSGIFISSLQSFFPEEKHKNLSTLFPEEIIRQISGEESYDYSKFITILIHKNSLDFTRKKDITEDIIEKLEHRRSAERKDVDKIDQIDGEIANEGKVTATARVVLRKDQADKLNEGEVLVSEMTTPDYISAMKKASAIVTNEGGMTSHAAITARELGKPCIVGTEIATQVLSDGDKVEADAEEGVVKVLEKNKW